MKLEEITKTSRLRVNGNMVFDAFLDTPLVQKYNDGVITFANGKEYRITKRGKTINDTEFEEVKT